MTLSWKHPSGLVGLSFVNLGLMIVTLGIYGFWAKTEVRKRIWSAVRIEGEPLHYTGTGKELFVGFLVAFFMVLVPLMLSVTIVSLVFGPQSIIRKLYTLMLYAGIFLLIGYATYRAQRYRLSRTHWRGIRGALIGSAGDYAWTYLGTGLLVILSLGWALPWRSTKLQGIMTRDMYFGTQAFRFDAKSGPLYARFAVLWLAAVIIFTCIGAGAAAVSYYDIYGGGAPLKLGPDGRPLPQLSTLLKIYGIILVGMLALAVFRAWYRASQLRHFFEHTHFDGATLKSTLSTRGLIWVAVTNVLILVATLGILSPVTQARMARYIVENLQIDGTVRLAVITQGADQHIHRGEGLAQAFDLDGF